MTSPRLSPVTARRDFLRFIASSPLWGSALPWSCVLQGDHDTVLESDDDAVNVFSFEEVAGQRLSADAWAFLRGGADDEYTLQANREAYRRLQIRVRRLIDVRSVQIQQDLFGEQLACPILVAPVGFQQIFHPEGECDVARAAADRQTPMILSSASSFSVAEVRAAGGHPVWFQLYPTPDRGITAELLRRAEAAGSRILVLTVDTPIIGNREQHGDYLRQMLSRGLVRMGNYEGLAEFESVNDPSMTWQMISWLRQHTAMKIVLKGIVTAEDAELAVQHQADGIIVSNHGGRQEESNRATLDCLEEVVVAAGAHMPILIDGGIRRGTDVFKALALGARAVCVGRPPIWGLASFGAAGVGQILDLLQAELIRIMQLAGTTSLDKITRSHVTV
jgi:isopentenyl diphosphate isomerase/L-lactate dehydrogenase-like FMN-dependent dehydrogenase